MNLWKAFGLKKASKEDQELARLFHDTVQDHHDEMVNAFHHYTDNAMASHRYEINPREVDELRQDIGNRMGGEHKRLTEIQNYLEDRGIDISEEARQQLSFSNSLQRDMSNSPSQDPNWGFDPIYDPSAEGGYRFSESSTHATRTPDQYWNVDKMLRKVFGIYKVVSGEGSESSLPYGMSSDQYDVLRSHFRALWLHQDDLQHESNNARDALRDFTRRVGPWYARGLYGRVHKIPDAHLDVMNLPDDLYHYSAPNEWHTKKEFNEGEPGEAHPTAPSIGGTHSRGHGANEYDNHVYGSHPEFESYPRGYDSGSKYNPAPPLGEESDDPRTELPFRPLKHIARNMGELVAYHKHGFDPANWPDDTLKTHTPNRTPDEVMNVERYPGEHTAPPPPDDFDTDWWDSQMDKMLRKMFGIRKDVPAQPLGEAFPQHGLGMGECKDGQCLSNAMSSALRNIDLNPHIVHGSHMSLEGPHAWVEFDHPKHGKMVFDPSSNLAGTPKDMYEDPASEGKYTTQSGTPIIPRMEAGWPALIPEYRYPLRDYNKLTGKRRDDQGFIDHPDYKIPEEDKPFPHPGDQEGMWETLRRYGHGIQEPDLHPGYGPKDFSEQG